MRIYLHLYIVILKILKNAHQRVQVDIFELLVLSKQQYKYMYITTTEELFTFKR